MSWFKHTRPKNPPRPFDPVDEKKNDHISAHSTRPWNTLSNT